MQLTEVRVSAIYSLFQCQTIFLHAKQKRHLIGGIRLEFQQLRNDLNHDVGI
jgi:hypothetical protein